MTADDGELQYRITVSSMAIGRAGDSNGRNDSKATRSVQIPKESQSMTVNASVE